MREAPYPHFLAAFEFLYHTFTVFRHITLSAVARCRRNFDLGLIAKQPYPGKRTLLLISLIKIYFRILTLL